MNRFLIRYLLLSLCALLLNCTSAYHSLKPASVDAVCASKMIPSSIATSWYQVLAIRLTDRVGKGIRSAPRDAMIADASSPGTRGLAFGFHRAMDHLGAVVGPLLSFALIYLIAANRNEPGVGD